MFIWSLDYQVGLEQKGLNKSTLNCEEYNLSDKIKVAFGTASCTNLHCW